MSASVVTGGKIVQAGHIHGDVVFTVDQKIYRLAPWPESRSIPGAWEQPSRLLAPQYAVVPFDSERRRTQLDQMALWRDSAGSGVRAGVSVMLVHGPGGQGKTRLAAHVADQSARVGWRVLVARHGRGSGRHGQSDPPDQVELVGRDARGLVVVVDYAERWPTMDLLLLVEDLSGMEVPVRLLLLARPAGLWWSALAHDLHTRDVQTQVLALPPLAPGVVDRRSVFTAARDAFATALRVCDADKIDPPTALADKGFHLVLTVHMAALVAVHKQYLQQQEVHTGSGRRAREDADPVTLAAYLLERERAHWHRLHASGAIGTRADTMAAATYLAALTGPLSYRDGQDVLASTGVTASVETAHIVLADHAYCYPPPAAAATVLEPLYPDRLAEDFLALQTPLLPGSESDGLYADLDPWTARGYQADPWADTVLTELFASTEVTSAGQPGWTRSAITVLIETARRWPHIARQRLYPLLRAHPELAVSAGSTALSALASLDQDAYTDTGILDVLEAVEAVLPRHRHVELDVGAAAVTQRLVEHRLAMASDATEMAELHLALGYRYGHAGLYQQALVHTAEAIALLVKVVKADPSTHMSTLALALNNTSLAFGQLGQWEAGLSAATEAVRIRRRMAEQHPDEALPDLAISLSNLSLNLSALGRWDEALAASTEATQIRCDLARQHPDAPMPDLMAALVNLSAQSRELGRWEDSLAASTEAVECYRHLAEQQPETYLPDLAASLTNLAAAQGELGQRDDGLAANIEAVECHRHLAEQQPDTWLPDLATSLTNLSHALGELGQRDEAFAAVTEAVQIRRSLANQHPDTYLPELANSLNSLSVWAGSLRRREEAFAAVTEAVQIRRCLAQQRPDTFLRHLADSLSNLSVSLAEMRRWKDGLAAMTEAVEIRRRLAEQRPDVFLPDLADSLHNLAVWFDELGRSAEGVLAAAEAMEIRSRLAEKHPTSHTTKLDQTRRLLMELCTGTRRKPFHPMAIHRHGPLYVVVQPPL